MRTQRQTDRPSRDWLKIMHLIGGESGCEFSGPVTKQSQTKQKQSRETFDTRLKVVLCISY